MKFEWDDKKAKLNYNKHHVTFERATTVFKDRYARVFYDEKHSINEDRYLIIGVDSLKKELTVVYCERDNDIVRLISARMATKDEIELYYEGRF